MPFSTGRILTGGPLPRSEGGSLLAMRAGRPLRGLSRGFTLVEMLVAMALTLLMMAAVVAVFASVSESVANRRASIEMSTALRHARSLLQADLANHTCPALTWTKIDSNSGYLQVIEGPQSDFDPSIWLVDEDNDGIPDPLGSNNLQLDLASSQLPSSSAYRLPGSSVNVRDNDYATDGRGLGDWDDVLMLTSRNEKKPYVGRIPADVFGAGGILPFDEWGSEAIESTLAEVVWFAVENPVEQDKTFYFGEPGFRTVYRRALLIAPWLDFGYNIGGVVTGPGVLRVLPPGVDLEEADQAAAALIAFQERYDISVRLVWDPLLGDDGRWVIHANTLADLTNRENRYEHISVEEIDDPSGGGLIKKRRYPFRPAFSGANRPAGTIQLRLTVGQDVRGFRTSANAAADAVAVPNRQDAQGEARPDNNRPSSTSRSDIQSYRVADKGQYYGNRPFVMTPIETDLSLNPQARFAQPTVRAVVNESGEVVMFTNGMVPLSGERRGEDVLLTNMLAFDLKVYDPHAPLLAEFPLANEPGEIVAPGSPAWGALALRDCLSVDPPLSTYGRGAYVDLGYAGQYAYFAYRNPGVSSWPTDTTASSGYAALLGDSVFAGTMNDKYSPTDRPIQFPNPLLGPYSFQPYRTYDTWSTSYENNGTDDDTDGLVDEGTNGLDDNNQNGVDDPTERETAPPYDAPLRGVQVTLRAYELDSRQIREVKIKQTFVPK